MPLYCSGPISLHTFNKLTTAFSPFQFQYRTSNLINIIFSTRTTIAIFCAKMTINLPTQLTPQPRNSRCRSDSEFRTAIGSSLFEQWLKNVQSEKGLLADGSLSLTQVLIQGVDMFGKRVGFLKFKADVIDKETGQKVPGIVFARGPAVAVLILLDSEGQLTLCLPSRFSCVRVPVGRPILELPAGMLDDNVGDVVGTAIREVEEETGIKLNLDDMVDLTSMLDPSTGCKVIPSPGGCDEELSLLLYRGSVSADVIKQLQGKETGLREHGELIKVRVVPYETLWRMTPDAKVLMSIAIYEMAKRDGLLPHKMIRCLLVMVIWCNSPTVQVGECVFRL